MSAATKTVEIKGWIVFDPCFARHPDIWPSPFRFQDYEPQPDHGSGSIAIRPHSITVEVPADFDPRPGMVKALEEQKRKAQADFAARVTEIERQISELTAIEFTGSEA